MRIIFNYPSVNIGGAQLLFARICQFFFEKNINVAIISDGECFLSKFLVQSEVKCEFIDASSNNVLGKDDVLVLSLAQVYMYEKVIQLGAETRVVFWDLYPYNLIQWMSLFPIYKRNPDSKIAKLAKLLELKRIDKIRNFCSTAQSHKALYFMCKKNFKTNADFYDLVFEPTYMPIPIDNSHSLRHLSAKPERVDTKEVNIGWISRLDSDKVRILLVLIDDLEEYKKGAGDDCQIKLHVIGDGPASSLITRSESIQILCKGRVDGSELDEYLNKNIDIGFSMGTSAFEFANRGIPSILVPNSASTRQVLSQNRKYLWLFDVEGFDVAAEEYYQEKTLNVETILSEFKRKPVQLSEYCRQHAQSNHSLQGVCDRLLGLISDSNLTGSDMLQLKLNEITLFDRFLLFLKHMLKRMLAKKL
jgi:hypothetical protein